MEVVSCIAFIRYIADAESWLHLKPEKSFNFCQTNRPLQINGTRMSNQIFYGLFAGNKEHGSGTVIEATKSKKC